MDTILRRPHLGYAKAHGWSAWWKGRCIIQRRKNCGYNSSGLELHAQWRGTLFGFNGH
ncbi:MAG: hypothetical protein IPI91_19230 [Flavobacteriales bacterium]|nr:hypothetical protein [Flavobacteriales bacterium]